MKRAHVLIVAKEASLREGLSALLAAIPGVGDTTQARGLADARQKIEAQVPELVVLDVDEDGLEFLNAVRSSNPDTKCLLLVEGMRQQTQAQLAGADVALIKGYPAQELIETVQALLSRRD